MTESVMRHTMSNSKEIALKGQRFIIIKEEKNCESHKGATINDQSV